MPQKIVIAGLGYVGCVSAACFAHLGLEVVGVDPDQRKVDHVNQAAAPFYEPGLDELIREAVAAGRLRAATTVTGELADADVVLVCVGTPSERNGNIALSYLRRAAEEIGHELRRAGRTKAEPLIVAIRSTVFPGTCEEVVRPALSDVPAVVVSNPEFLREGAAVDDFLRPSLLVVGGDDLAAVKTVANLYASLPVEACLVSLRTAEMIKYACNCFHAVKVAFANEIGSLAEALGVSGAEVMHTLCQDRKLNLSAAYLRPGFAFGGSCLPKDLRALVYRAQRLDLTLPLLENTLPSNQRHLQRAIHRLLGLEGRIAIFGLAFKENTDDLRESPVVELIEQLLGKGRDLRIFDPHIRIDEIYGSNRSFILQSIPHISKFMCSSVAELAAGASHLVITQKVPAALEAEVRATALPVIDVSGTWKA